MIVRESELLRFLVVLRRRSPAQVSAAVKAIDASDPFGAMDEAKALLKTPDQSAAARVVVRSVKSALGDLDEHGKHSTFHGEGARLKAALKKWEKLAGGEEAPEERVLLCSDFLPMTVLLGHQVVEGAEEKAWKKLRSAKKLVTALEPVAKKPPSPFFVEMIAAYVASELAGIFRSAVHRETLQSKLVDVPRLLLALKTASSATRWPELFGALALEKAADLAAFDPKTRALLAKEFP